MKLVRSDAPEIAGCLSSAGARASRSWPGLRFAFIANLLTLAIIVMIDFTVSARTAAWLSAPVFLALNGYVFFRAITSRQRWVIGGCAGRVYVRIFTPHRGGSGITEPDTIVFDAPEIATMFARVVELFPDGPSPRIVEWLVIKPSQVAAEEVARQIYPLLRRREPDRTTLVAVEEGRLNIEWKWWSPAPQLFLRQLV